MKTVIYQMLPREWGDGSLASIDAPFLKYLRSLGITHLYLTGIIRHSSGKPYVKGDPGSPYSIIDYYDVNPYLCPKSAKTREARIECFRKHVAEIHQAGLEVIIDFVPNHISPDYSDPHGGIPHLDRCDYDWTDTRKVDYDAPETFTRMSAILRFWASMGVDGFRCDMVELVPNAFYKEAFGALKKEFNGIIFIGEAYTPSNYDGLLEAGFDFLYDKSGLYDSLQAIVHYCEPIKRLNIWWQEHGRRLPHMLSFLENHDEVRVASHEFAGNGRRALAALGVAALYSGAPLMIYFGQEIGLDASESDNCRTSIFSITHPDGLRRLYNHIHGTGDGLLPREVSLLKRYQALKPLLESDLFSGGGTFDLSYCNPQLPGVFPFLRTLGGETMLVVANFSAVHISTSIVIPAEASEFCLRKIQPSVKVDVENQNFITVNV